MSVIAIALSFAVVFGPLGGQACAFTDRRDNVQLAAAQSRPLFHAGQTAADGAGQLRQRARSPAPWSLI